MTKERITYLDSLKGLLILLVIIGHSGAPDFIMKPISLFYMPAFFMLSGMFVKPLAVGGTKRMLLKYVRTYLVPYYIVVVIVILMSSIGFYFLYPGHSIIFTNAKPMILELVTGRSVWPMWFLFALFWGLTLYRTLSKKLSGVMLLCVVLSISIISISKYPNVSYLTIPFYILQGLGAVIFLYVGNILRLHWNSVQQASNKWITYIIVLAIFIYRYIMDSNGAGTLAVYCPLGFTNVIFSVFASVFVICKSKYIDCKFLNYIGQHTLLILCIHAIFIKFTIRLNFPFWETALINIIPVLIIVYAFVRVREYVSKRYSITA